MENEDAKPMGSSLVAKIDQYKNDFKILDRKNQVTTTP